MTTTQLTNHIEHLERLLQSPEVRCSKEQFDNLLADDFTEIGRSGHIYTKETILYAIKDSDEVNVQYLMSDFKLKMLTETILQVTYRTEMISKGEHSYALRSSLWRLEEDSWRMFFHQGTPMHKDMIPNE